MEILNKIVNGAFLEEEEIKFILEKSNFSIDFIDETQNDFCLCCAGIVKIKEKLYAIPFILNSNKEKIYWSQPAIEVLEKDSFYIIKNN